MNTYDGSYLFHVWRYLFLYYMVLSAQVVVEAMNCSVRINNNSGSNKIYHLYRRDPNNHASYQSIDNWTINNGEYTIGVVTTQYEFTEVWVTATGYDQAQAEGANLTFTDGGQAPPPWKYHYNVCNTGPYRRQYKLYDESNVLKASIDLQPGDCATGDIQWPDGQKHTLTIQATQFGTDGNDQYGVADIPTNDPGWYQDTPPNTSPTNDPGKTPPDGSSQNATNIIYFPNTTDLAKERTLQTVGNVLHSDITQGLQSMNNGLIAVGTKLDRANGLLGDIKSVDTTGFSSVNNQLTTANNNLTQMTSAINTMGGKLDQIKTTAENIGTTLDQFKTANHDDLMSLSNKMAGLKEAIDIVGTNTTKTNYYTQNQWESFGTTMANEAIGRADAATQATRDQLNNMESAAHGWGGDKTVYAAPGSFWQIPIPIGAGQFTWLNANPMESEVLTNVVPWIRMVLLWIVRAIAIVFCYRIAVERYDAIVHTPAAQQQMNAGGAAGAFGLAWQIGKAIFQVIAGPALCALVAYMLTHTVMNQFFTYMETSILASNNSYVLTAIYLLNWFAPITETITTFAECMAFWFGAMSLTVLWTGRKMAAGI